jgi:hypothetical protein
MEFILVRIFLMIVCLLFNQNSYAKEDYLYELKQFIIAFKPAYDIEKEFRKLIFDKSNDDKIEFRTVMRQCALNDLDMFHENMIPVFKKHYSISELKKLHQSLKSKEGEIYLEYAAGIISGSSLKQEQIEAINMIANIKEIMKLEPLSAELVDKSGEYGLMFRDSCLEKYQYEKSLANKPFKQDK